MTQYKDRLYECQSKHRRVTWFATGRYVWVPLENCQIWLPIGLEEMKCGVCDLVGIQVTEPVVERPTLTLDATVIDATSIFRKAFLGEEPRKSV